MQNGPATDLFLARRELDFIEKDKNYILKCSHLYIMCEAWPAQLSAMSGNRVARNQGAGREEGLGERSPAPLFKGEPL